MVLKKVFRKSTGRYEYALVSKINPHKILFYFGPSKPSEKSFLKQERRIQFFKNLKGKKNFGSISKRIIWIKRKDMVKQRYWIGKSIKKNYGSIGSMDRHTQSMNVLSKELDKIKNRRTKLRDLRIQFEHRIGQREELTPSEEEYITKNATEDLELAKKEIPKEDAIREEFELMGDKNKLKFMEGIGSDNWHKWINFIKRKELNDDED